MNFNFYLVDDDPSVLAVLSKIIVNKNLGDVVGTNKTGDGVLQDIKRLNPDLVIIDLLLPEIDGIALSRQIKSQLPKLPIVMISEVQTKDMVSKAYESGIEFYINKPINVIEVVNVIERVHEKVKMQAVIKNFQNAFDAMQTLKDFAEPSVKPQSVLDKTRQVLGELGILSEAGTKDLILLVDFIFGVNDGVEKRVSDYRMSDLYGMVCETYEGNHEKVMARTIEQRIRRAASSALEHIAQVGLDDYEHQVFNTYSHLMFEFKEVRQEMDYISGKSKYHGKTNNKKFLIGLCQSIRE